MPIEFFSPTSGGAIATIIAETGRPLLAAGHRVTVLTPVDGTTTYDVGDVLPLATKRRDHLSFLGRRASDLRRHIGRWDWPYFEFYLKSVQQRLAELAARDAPDVIVLFNDLYSSPHVRRAVPTTARIAVWLQNEWRTHSANLPATVAATDVFLTCSRYIADWTSRSYGIPAGQFTVVPSGVDLAGFHPRDGYLDPMDGPVKVLFIGRIDRNKGPDLAADAVAALQRESMRVQLTVAGGLWFYGNRDPTLDPFFRELSEKMRRVNAAYLGHVVRADVPALIRAHDIVCVLSRSNEPFGLVVLEAMASGCAVIASNRGGLPEACGEAATLLNPDNIDAVVSAMRALVLDNKLLAQAKRRSVARAALASWKETSLRLLEATSALAVA